MLDELCDSMHKTRPTGEQADRLTKLFKSIGTHTPSDTLASVTQLKDFAVELDGSIKELVKVLDDLEDVITDKTMTSLEAGVIGTLSNFESMTEYLTDLAYYVSYVITDSEANLTKVVVLRIEEGANEFNKLFRTYNRNDVSTVTKSLRKLSSVRVHDNAVFALSATKSDKSFIMPFNSLTINPFYYLGTFLVDLEMLYFDYLKYKKELLEFKIKEREYGNDPATKKQIEYYEKRLAEIEAKMDAIKEGYDV
jgi:hypothetical protein